MGIKKSFNPLILQHNRLMQAFAKSDDEKDFYLDRQEGFIVYVNLDKSEEELAALEKELKENAERYCPIPKLTFFETKKIMEGFVNEKVFDIDTKEKLLDIIQSKEARENFLEFIYDHHNELEKWQQFYQERSRIRIIEWLRNNSFHFVFEEDLDLSTSILEKLKSNLFKAKVPKEIASTRSLLESKAKTYYSSEALNPRPKRGRPPKQAAKAEVEHKVSVDIYTTVALSIRPFIFTPEITNATAVTFSSKFGGDREFLSGSRSPSHSGSHAKLEALNQKLETLRSLSNRFSQGKNLLNLETNSVTLAPTELGSPNEVDGDKEFLSDSQPVQAAVPAKPRRRAAATKAPAKKAKSAATKATTTTTAKAKKAPTKKATTAKKTTKAKAKAAPKKAKATAKPKKAPVKKATTTKPKKKPLKKLKTIKVKKK